ncbi:MAG: methyltransferase domain-containing protein [Scytonema sp. PMC 1069.18]|nr:methyltransferase domain-containing protein [Scytonema sp. PMC 1069.18]MEC4884230.1 methyltransferase domain-containing protein [Scytonema sp. PMC 1070.18]
MRKIIEEIARPITAEKYSPPSFDCQADTYDQRVGLTEIVCCEIVRAVLAIALVQPGDLLVEVGAGTGTIGKWFVQSPVRYVGFDVSQAMLEMFRMRLDSEGDNWKLVQADGNQQWPMTDSTARVIFSSRAIHLLELEHVVDESFRIACSEGAALLLGRVERQKQSVKALMQQQMQHRLQQLGFQGRKGEQKQRQLIELCCQRGAKVIDPVVVSRWKVASTPRESLNSWQQKEGLAGIHLPSDIQQEILNDLQIWAEANFGGLDQQVESEEAYVLQGVYLAPID